MPRPCFLPSPYGLSVWPVTRCLQRCPNFPPFHPSVPVPTVCPYGNRAPPTRQESNSESPPTSVPVPSMEFPSRNPRKSHPPQLPAAYRPHQRTCPLRPTHLWVARRGLFLSATFRPSTKTHTSEAVAPETRGRWLSGCTHPRGGCSRDARQMAQRFFVPLDKSTHHRGGCIAFLKCVWCRVMFGKTCRWYDTRNVGVNLCL